MPRRRETFGLYTHARRPKVLRALSCEAAVRLLQGRHAKPAEDQATIAEIDEALAHASLAMLRGDGWHAFVDQLLDQRLEATT